MLKSGPLVLGVEVLPLYLVRPVFCQSHRMEQLQCLQAQQVPTYSQALFDQFDRLN